MIGKGGRQRKKEIRERRRTWELGKEEDREMMNKVRLGMDKEGKGQGPGKKSKVKGEVMVRTRTEKG